MPKVNSFFFLFLGISLLQFCLFWQQKPPHFPSPPKTSMQVQTFQLEKPLPKTPSAPSIKLVAQKKELSPSLSQKLQASLRKVSSKKRKASLSSPLPIPLLAKVGKKAKEPASTKEDLYAKKVIQVLEENLQLLENDQVKLQISIEASGKVHSFRIIKCFSKKNLSYLKKALPILHFPCFNGEDNQKTFTINLCGK